jgi:hypothetical protein
MVASTVSSSDVRRPPTKIAVLPATSLFLTVLHHRAGRLNGVGMKLIAFIIKRFRACFCRRRADFYTAQEWAERDELIERAAKDAVE